MDENLDKNLLFNTLRTKHIKFYELASEDCSLFVIPRNKYLKLVNINDTFITHHILKPSKLLKLHYSPYKKCSILDVQVDNDQLIIQYSNGEKGTEKIIGEEIAYNGDNKLYKILLVDKPLIKFKINPSLLSSKDEPSQTIYFTFEECESYLTALSPACIKEVNEKVTKFMKTYLILPDYLDDAANKVKNLIDTSARLYANRVLIKFDQEVLIISLECYILALLWPELYPVTKLHYSATDQKLIDQLKRLKSDEIDLSHFDCNEKFKAYKPSKRIYEYLDEILKKKSPIEKLKICKQILDRINNELVEFLDMKVYSPFSKCHHEVLADDLVSVVVYILIKFNLNNIEKKLNLFLVSDCRYIQKFSFYVHMEASFGYALTTFDVAINYVKDNHFESSPIKSDAINGWQSATKSSNESIKSLSTKKASNNSSIDQSSRSQVNCRKQLNFNAIKLNEDLEKITKQIEDDSFSFQVLENTEKTDTLSLSN